MKSATGRRALYEGDAVYSVCAARMGLEGERWFPRVLLMSGPGHRDFHFPVGLALD